MKYLKLFENFNGEGLILAKIEELSEVFDIENIDVTDDKYFKFTILDDIEVECNGYNNIFTINDQEYNVDSIEEAFDILNSYLGITESLSDYILDKINKRGIESLSTKEKEYLTKHANAEDVSDLESDLWDRAEIFSGRLDYDPREDDSHIFPGTKEWIDTLSDQEILDGNIEHIWDNDLTNSDIEDFKLTYDVKSDINKMPYHKLSSDVKKRLKMFIEDQIAILKTKKG